MTVYQQERQLSDVASKANASGAGLFVSVHCNAAGNRNATGTETWHYTGCPTGQKVAKAIQRAVTSELGTRDRGVKSSRSLYVLRKTSMPAVLVETGFLSNKEEERLLVARAEDIGRAIAKGVIAAI